MITAISTVQEARDLHPHVLRGHFNNSPSPPAIALSLTRVDGDDMEDDLPRSEEPKRPRGYVQMVANQDGRYPEIHGLAWKTLIAHQHGPRSDLHWLQSLNKAQG